MTVAAAAGLGCRDITLTVTLPSQLPVLLPNTPLPLAVFHNPSTSQPAITHDRKSAAATDSMSLKDGNEPVWDSIPNPDSIRALRL